MEFRIELSCVDNDGREHRSKLQSIRRTELCMASLGLTLSEGKALLRDLQSCMIDRQATAWLEHHRSCSHCGRRYASKAGGQRVVSSVYGGVTVPNPRWRCCSCQRDKHNKTFRPTAQWLTERTTPEMLYVETKWASLIPFAKVVDLLGDVLPVSETLHAQTVQNHLHALGERLEQALGEEDEERFEGTEESWAAQPLPDGPMTVGIDGGMLRGRNQSGFFEAIAGKSVVAFRRDEAADVPSARRFAFVQTYDAKPRRRLWDLMKSQGLQENQAITFLSDGADTVRNLQSYLHPLSEHVLDYFHVTMRLTVLGQQAKSVAADDAKLGEVAARELESTKHFLWHGNVERAFETLDGLAFDLGVQRRSAASIAKLYRAVSDFEAYLRSNREYIPNYGERYRHGETITTSFVESTINEVISKRFVKKQQMQWTPRGAHLLLQTRTRVLDEELENVFRDWYPGFRPKQSAPPGF